MSFYLYLLLGFIGGIPAGMGLGGGTLTIPLLTVFGGVEQKLAQAVNLFAFLPMSIGSLKVHAQNGLLETKGIWWLIAPALLFSACCGLVMAYLPSSFLRKGFGVFLILLAFSTYKKK